MGRRQILGKRESDLRRVHGVVWRYNRANSVAEGVLVTVLRVGRIRFSDRR